MKNSERQLRKRFEEADLSKLESDPLDGHLERFETKILRQNQSVKHKRTNFRMFGALLIAASFIGFVLFWVVKSSDELDQIEFVENGSLEISNYSEMAGQQQVYFEELISKKKSILDTSDPEIKEMVDALLKLETDYDGLQDKLSENFHNEHLINAIINNYKLRVELLEKIQKIIQVKNKIKNQKDEKVYS